MPDINVEPYLAALVEAGRQLLAADYRPGEVIEQSISARSGAPPPSAWQARTFQEGVLQEIRAA